MMRTEVDGFESGNQERRKLIEVAAIETRSAPALLGATHRAFTFYLGNPISSIETCSLPSSLAAVRRGFTFYLADPSARLTSIAKAVRVNGASREAAT